MTQRRLPERLPLLAKQGVHGDRIKQAKALPLVYAGDPVLREGTRLVTPEELQSERVQTLIAQMVVTMREAPGVGLAAPQIGSDLAIAVIEDEPELHGSLPEAERSRRAREKVPLICLVNPVLERVPGNKGVTFAEGCLSVPGYVADVRRDLTVSVRGLDADGQPFLWRPTGWPARIAQHEIDHLRGLLYIDKMQTKTFAYSAVSEHQDS